jgi:spore maturation protein CgeB
VLGAVESGLPLTLVGGGWERYIDPRRVKAEHVPFDELPGWYASAEVVLNDHWEDMARWGLLSNRVFDALAAGACVVSDEIAGDDDLLAGAVVTFRSSSEVGPLVRRLLEDPHLRAERALRGRREVLEAHTWQHRAAALVAMVGSRVAADDAT